MFLTDFSYTTENGILNMGGGINLLKVIFLNKSSYFHVN